MNQKQIFPPGPTQHSWAQLRAFIKQPLDLFKRSRADYGSLFTLRLWGQPPYVVVSEPAHLKQIFTASPDVLHAGAINAAIFKPILGASSLLTLDGCPHLRHRKLILPAFHGEKMAGYGKQITDVTKKKIQTWRVGQELSVLNEVRAITFDIILQNVFGLDASNVQAQQFIYTLHQLIDLIKKPLSLLVFLNPGLHRHLGPFTPWKKMMRLRAEVDAYLYQEIDQRRRLPCAHRMDILSLLLQAQDEQGRGMSQEEIRDELMTLLIAGHETSTTGIAWTLYWILSHPEVEQQVRLELNQVSPSQPFLEACIKEALRLIPVVPYITRLTQSKYELGGYDLPKGSVIAPSIYLAHHHPEFWPHPEQFIPERFLSGPETPYTYLPFGGGVRRCIGAAFAHDEMKKVVAEILKHALLKLKPGYRAQPLRKGVVMCPSKGLPVLIRQLF